MDTGVVALTPTNSGAGTLPDLNMLTVALFSGLYGNIHMDLFVTYWLSLRRIF